MPNSNFFCFFQVGPAIFLQPDTRPVAMRSSRPE
jgi:hypothetical protein